MLQKELNKTNLQQSKINEIIDNHSRMFILGAEAGLSDDEVIKNIGSPKSVALHYGIPDEKTKETIDILKEGNPGLKKSFICTDKYGVDVRLFDEDLYVDYHDDDNIILFVSENFDEKKYEISFIKNKLLIRNKKSVLGYLGKKTEVRLDLYLPKRFKMDCFNLSSVRGYNEITSLVSSKMELSNVSGLINAANLKAVNLNIKTVSGKIQIGTVYGDKSNISSVTGHILIKKLLSDRSSVSSVVGNVEILDGSESGVKSESLAGNVKISNERTHTALDSLKVSKQY